MEEPRYRINEIKKLSEVCRKVSAIELSNSASIIRAIKAEKLFEKITLHAISLGKLLPVKDEEESYKTLDAAAVASIARNIIDTHHVYHYLCERGISNEEFKYRVYLDGLHYATNIHKILEKLKFEENDNIFQAFDISRDVSIRLLKNNSVFKGHTSREQNELLKGNKAYFFGRQNKNISPFDQDIESGIFNLLSNSVHTFPLGLMNSSYGGTKNHLNLLNLIFVSLEVSIIYLASVAIAYFNLRKNISQLLNTDDKDFIRMMTDTQNFYHWLEYRKQEGKEKYFL